MAKKDSNKETNEDQENKVNQEPTERDMNKKRKSIDVEQDPSLIKFMKAIDEEDRKYIKNYVQVHTDEFKPSSLSNIVVGTFILWICWLFFNGGSTFAIMGIVRKSSP